MKNNNHHEEQIQLPPGFRFHPTDEELIFHYLYPKVFDSSFASRAIGDVDLNKFEPWDLPLRAKMGEDEWYFFCVRDRKYPTGFRANRATEMGYWKATGKDKEIYKAKMIIGMKKTLVFYKGRAPKGEKTNWIMHEFRLEGELSVKNLPKLPKGEWVISKVFEKNFGRKKIQISQFSSMNDENSEDEFGISNFPPLMDAPSIQDQKPKNENLIKNVNKSTVIKPLKNDKHFKCPNSTQMAPNIANLEHYDPSLLKLLIDNDDCSNMRQNPTIVLGNDQDYTMKLAGAVDLDCLWSI